MKVAILIPRLSGGGAEFVALEWARHLGEQGHPVTLVTTHGGAEDPGDRCVVPLVATSFPARVRELRQHLRAAGYDVLLSLMPHWNVLALLSTAGLASAPAVVISGRNVESALKGSQGASYRLETGLARLLYRRTDAYVAISHPVAAEAAARYGIDAGRIWVVPNPSTAKVPAAPTHPLSSRGHESANGGRTVTLTVPARLVRQKRPELAVEVARILTAEHGVTASVDYFGSGGEEEAVRRAAARSGVGVTFRGWVDAWFSSAARDAVVLLPSSAEGFGNVLVEAAAVGIPSVASSHALGVADAIVPHVTGMLSISSEPADYAAAVLRAMALTPVSAPGWLERFSPEESGRLLLQVLQAQTGSRADTSTDQPVGGGAEALAGPRGEAERALAG